MSTSDAAMKAEIAKQKEERADAEMARRMQAEMNNQGGGQMMMDEEEFMIGGNDFGNEKKVPHFGFYNNFDDVLADE